MKTPTEIRKKIFILPFLSFYKASSYLKIVPIQENTQTSFIILSEEAQQMLEKEKSMLTYFTKRNGLMDKEYFQNIAENVIALLKNCCDSIVFFIEDKHKADFYQVFSKQVETSILEYWHKKPEEVKSEEVLVIPACNNFFKQFSLEFPNDGMSKLFISLRERVN